MSARVADRLRVRRAIRGLERFRAKWMPKWGFELSAHARPANDERNVEHIARLTGP
jgi:hypothetical protein